MTNFTKLHPEYVDVPNPTLRDAKDAMGDFLGSVRTENGHRFNSPEAEGDKRVVLNDRSIEKLLCCSIDVGIGHVYTDKDVMVYTCTKLEVLIREPQVEGVIMCSLDHTLPLP